MSLKLETESKREMTRVRPLSTYGQELYESTVNRHLFKIREIKREIDGCIDDIKLLDFGSISRPNAGTYEKLLKSCYEAYRKCSEDFVTYLQSMRTNESINEMAAQRLIMDSVKAKVGAALFRLDELTQETDLKSLVQPRGNSMTQANKPRSPRVPSRKGSPKRAPSEYSSHSLPSLGEDSFSSSGTSRRSSSYLQRAEAKLNASRVKLKYIAEEVMILKEKAVLDARLKLSKAECEVEMNEKEIEVMRDVYTPNKEDSRSSRTRRSRTEEYIRTLPNQYTDNQNIVNPSKADPKSSSPVIYHIQADNLDDPCPGNTMLRPDAVPFTPNRPSFHEDREIIPSPVNRQNSNNANNDHPVNPQNLNNANNNSAVHQAPTLSPPTVTDQMTEFTKFLVKKDLLMSRLTKYDDNPMLYVSWKLNFKGIMKELGTTATEELDLIVRWLGPASSKQANSIRACNADNPALAVKKIWERLEERFGSPEMVERSLKERISSFPRIAGNDNKRLFDLADLVSEIAAVKEQPQYSILFGYFDSSTGINPIASKLPWNLQDKWVTEASRFKRQNGSTFPPFSLFVKFIHDTARTRNDPSFQFDRSEKANMSSSDRSSSRRLPTVVIKKTETTTDAEGSLLCPLHGTSHLLNQCSAFRKKPLEERKKFILTNGICFKCCGPKRHRAANCRANVQCDICKETSHPSALHMDANPNVGEHLAGRTVKSACTQVCGRPSGTSRSCAKIIPVRVYLKEVPDKSRVVYALVDDQSSHSLATTPFFDFFSPGSMEYQYVLSSCAGRFTASGRKSHSYVIESLDSTCKLDLPSIIECNDIPKNRDEIPFPAIARQYSHLQEIAQFIPTIMEDVEIELLIGRDVVTAHHVLDQRLGEGDLPIGQRLPLGWVIIGQVCMTNLHHTNVINVNKTFVLQNGRPSLFKPCDSKFQITDNTFVKTEHDEKTGLSIEDKAFLQLMENGFKKEGDGHWSAPLPFRQSRPVLPNNKAQALKRAKAFDLSLQRDPLKRQHVLEFMEKIFTHEHAEKAPPMPLGQECWYLPMFGVYHPKKPSSIRVVFDSSARYGGVSLNDVLMKGPDLSNSLQGILLRFRQNTVAITADVEQMFHNFKVDEPDRNYLRFLWHQENDFEKPLDEYRMRVHVFGNSPSPTVATYGLHRSVIDADSDVQDFVFHNFYVDDGLVSCESEDQAVSLMKRTQRALMGGGKLRLHKIASNSKSVLKQFDQNDLAKDLKSIDLGSDALPTQRTLGVVWDIDSDEINFQVSKEMKPYTRRGVLSMINSLFDPLGFVAPVTLRGKVLLREMMQPSSSTNWDDPLPESFREQWENWVESLHYLKDIKIPRMYGRLSLVQASGVQVHVFCDASKDAIAAVAYIKTMNEDSSDIGFLLGKAKVAPSHGHTIPRLELCSAVVAVELAEVAKEQLNLKKEDFHFYSDSRVVLGYISAETRRFHVYVANRVSRIRAFCGPEQWNHVPTDENPADIATRKFTTSDLSTSMWLRGPDFLHTIKLDVANKHYPLIDAESDQELKKEVVTVKTTVKSVLGAKRFSRFSTWKSLVRALVTLKTLVRRTKTSAVPKDPALYESVEKLIIKEAQSEMYHDEIQAIRNGHEPPKNSPLLPLNPIVDGDGLLRVGGRIHRRQTHLSQDRHSAHPIIIPKGHHIAVLLIRHYHSVIHHQGRQMTEGAIRSAGYWVINCKHMVSSEIHQCVTCKRLRGKFGWVQMADLLEDRLKEAPPFSYVGLDVFGPWSVVTRRTRGGSANSKRWGVLFTCLVSRAIHVELVEEVSSASFINCLRRFIALRGPVQQIRSDRGTNFIGAVKELSLDAEFVESRPVKDYLTMNKVLWIFNPPHASHFGGVWERMIGSVRRILDALLLENKSFDLTHEVLSTLMAEVCTIVNSRPLVPVSSDPEAPAVLSPTLILTQKQPDATFSVPEFGTKDALRSQWKLVQRLADQFWSRWRTEYLSALQKRTKWHSGGEEINKGDVVLIKEEDAHRNQWPLGVVDEVFYSKDSKVRKVKVTIVWNGSKVSYVRPICYLVRLLEVI